MKTHEHSSITEGYVLIEVSTDPPLFVTVSGGHTSDVRMAEKFPDAKSAKKVQRASEKFPWGSSQTYRFEVARLTQVHAYKVEWGETEPRVSITIG